MTELISDSGLSDNRPAGRLALIAEFWHYFSENKGAVFGLFFFLAVVIMAVFANVLAPHLPNEQYRDAFLLPPFFV